MTAGSFALCYPPDGLIVSRDVLILGVLELSHLLICHFTIQDKNKACAPPGCEEPSSGFLTPCCRTDLKCFQIADAHPAHFSFHTREAPPTTSNSHAP
ncbi:hypothetical protein AAFF_G00002370 [Aldrovandia affinis]|uniref:Uncharacterized protein n=1 Tax=Aldrovandia affinis TaxID=143900 RepID=A0AAD7X3J1_9TELE|nr:hypothetical protein AAFF_G00002370 [Aldrovandia affinis]